MNSRAWYSFADKLLKRSEELRDASIGHNGELSEFRRALDMRDVAVAARLVADEEWKEENS